MTGIPSSGTVNGLPLFQWSASPVKYRNPTTLRIPMGYSASKPERYVDLPAEMHGQFAINERLAYYHSRGLVARDTGERFSVTHVPTGLCISPANSLAEARRIVARLEVLGLNWKFKSETTPRRRWPLAQRNLVKQTIAAARGEERDEPTRVSR